nr:hypothetical protein [Rickettsia endosymbiont of Ceutorhynchus assimilis]
MTYRMDSRFRGNDIENSSHATKLMPCRNDIRNYENLPQTTFKLITIYE